MLASYPDDINYDSLDVVANLYNYVVVGYNTRDDALFRVFDTVLPSTAMQLPEYHVGDVLAPTDVALLLNLNGQVDRAQHIIYFIVTREEFKELWS